MLIDPQGLFYGERIGACSDEAQLHFPRLMAAANGYGRIEMSVAKLHATVYAGFKRKPTREQLQKWFREYHTNFLLFVYRSGFGEVWGQWSVLRGRLPKWKTKEDEKSPVPPAKEFEAYLATYIEAKRAKLTSSGDHISISEDFERLPKASEDFRSLSTGEVVGEVEVVGEGIASATPLGVALPAKARATEKPKDAPHPLHSVCRAMIADVFGDLPWDGSEGKALDTLLAALPGVTAERLAAMVANRLASDVNLSERPRRWIANLADYERGPLDAFGKPKALRVAAQRANAPPNAATVTQALRVLTSEEREKQLVLDEWSAMARDYPGRFAEEAPPWVRNELGGQCEGLVA